MHICVVGTGYVGLVLGATLAELGHKVTCVDVDEEKIEFLQNGNVPIYEPGLKEMINENVQANKLLFTTSLEEGLKESFIVFIAVGTPQSEDGSADLSHVLSVASEIGKLMKGYTIVVDKSTVPVGTAEKVRNVIQHQLTQRGINVEFDVVSNPEFLREGNAIEDFMKPSRIVIGTDNPRTGAIMKELYRPLIDNGYPLYIMSISSAELTKYASNAMLAARISFMNEIASICEVVGADIAEVRVGMGSDRRIGMDFLNAGLGYGGSCFPKDLKALIKTATEKSIDPKIMNSVDQVNQAQKKKLVQKVVDKFGENLEGRSFAIWGLSFKPETDDMREAPSILTIKGLIEFGATVIVYDPVAMENAKQILGTNGITFADDPYEAIREVDALLIVTEWKQFIKPDFIEMKKRMKVPVIFDGRNIYDPIEMKKMGFSYYSIGRKMVHENL